MTNMTLPDALRLSGTMYPQAFGSAMDSNGGRCAMAGVTCVTGMTPVELVAAYPILAEDAICPVCGVTEERGLRVLIAQHLNDKHRWSRAEIADFVEALAVERAAQREAVAV